MSLSNSPRDFMLVSAASTPYTNALMHTPRVSNTTWQHWRKPFRPYVQPINNEAAEALQLIPVNQRQSLASSIQSIFHLTNEKQRGAMLHALESIDQSSRAPAAANLAGHLDQIDGKNPPGYLRADAIKALGLFQPIEMPNYVTKKYISIFNKTYFPDRICMLEILKSFSPKYRGKIFTSFLSIFERNHSKMSIVTRSNSSSHCQKRNAATFFVFYLHISIISAISTSM